VTNETGSAGLGVGVAMAGTGNAVVARAGAPVIVNSGLIDVTWAVSQVFARQPSPNVRWMVCSSE
jgi:hypothetical protein